MLIEGKLALNEWANAEADEADKADKAGAEEGAVDAVIELTHQQAIQWLRLPYALTYYTVQSRTLKGKHIVLEDTNNVHFTMRNLIVGMSRATDESLVNIVYEGASGAAGVRDASAVPVFFVQEQRVLEAQPEHVVL